MSPELDATRGRKEAAPRWDAARFLLYVLRPLNDGVFALPALAAKEDTQAAQGQ
jgi:hypothetical protein